MRFLLRGAGLAALMGLAALPASAAPIASLFPTGVDGSRALLFDGSLDPHYQVVGSGPAYAVRNPEAVGWIGNPGSASWISPSRDTYAGAGPFTYRTTFDLTGFDPSTALITGFIADDDQAEIYLNGALVFTSVSTYDRPWSYTAAVTISSAFSAGLNVLTIVVPNAIETSNDGPTGLMLNIAGTANLASAVPAPAPLAALGLGLVGLLATRRRNV